MTTARGTIISLAITAIVCCTSQAAGAATPPRAADAVRSAAGITGSAHVPETLASDAASRPFWISASAATSREGDVDYGVFSEGLRDAIRTQGRITPHGASVESSMATCEQYTVAFSEGAPAAMSTWHDALSNAPNVVVGRVTAVTPGFMSTSPATMLTVRVTDVLRGDGAVPVRSEMLVPYFAADFSIGDTRFCNAGRPRSGAAFLPAVNDTVLIFAFAAPRERFLSVADENLFFGRGDRIYAPASFARDVTLPATSSFKSLTAKARDDIERREARSGVR